MPFGFMPGKGTTDAIFIIRQVHERHTARKKKLYYLCLCGFREGICQSAEGCGEMGLEEAGCG